MSNDIVHFLMPDGTQVSNDPRFDQDKAAQAVIESTPNTGTVGFGVEEEKAQTQSEHPASLNSGQPGVGENAVPDNPTKDLHGVLGSPAQQLQKEDAKAAADAGASSRETSTPDPEPVDSNAAVLALRKEKASKAKAALEEAGEEEGDAEKPYSEWSAKQLKAEVARRNADGRDEEDLIKVSGLKKSEVAALLTAEDDAAETDEEDADQGDDEE